MYQTDFRVIGRSNDATMIDQPCSILMELAIEELEAEGKSSAYWSTVARRAWEIDERGDW